MRRIVLSVLVATPLGAAPLAAVQGAGAPPDTAGAVRVGGIAVLGGGAAPAPDLRAPRPVRRAPEPATFAGPGGPAVPALVHESAPFLVDGSRIPADSVAGRGADGTPAPWTSPRVGERVLVQGGRGLTPGDRLQSWRPGLRLDDRDRIAVPTATLTVTEVGGGWVVAVVDGLYDRIAPGDRVRVLPPPPTATADALVPVSSGRRVAIRAAASPRTALGPGDWVVLDAGADAGLRPGDEFVPVDGPDDLRDGARLQVVSVHDAASVARILDLGSTLLRPGRVVRLDRRAG